VSFKNILFESKDGLSRLTINRPDKLNALNRETVREIDAALDAFDKDAGARALILTGSGEKAFVAGADIGELAEQTPQGGKAYALYGQSVLSHLESSGKPTIAAINGFALGGGLEIALACHLRIASETASLGLPEVTLGIIPGFGGTQRLARLVGKGAALEMILTGNRIDAREAHRIGLVNRVVPSADLIAESEKLAGTILSRGPVAVRFAIESVNRGLEMPSAEGQFLEATLFGLLTTSEDMKEGTRAFLEKRKPAFSGR
jgi:enoyl-CoA hydratase